MTISKRCRARFHGKERCSKPVNHEVGANRRSKASWHEADAGLMTIQWRGPGKPAPDVAMLPRTAESNSPDHEKGDG